MERKVRNPVAVILLSLITCGIYFLYWSWVTNQQINAELGREDVGVGILILGWFCAPVMWYVWYKWDTSLVGISQGRNINYNSNFILWIILSVLAGVGYLVMLFQIQDTLNRVYGQD
jgi:hypothetical protein